VDTAGADGAEGQDAVCAQTDATVSPGRAGRAPLRDEAPPRVEVPESPTPASPHVLRHRPQQQLLSFMGALVLDRDYPPIGTRVFLSLLADLGVSEAAGRALLTRMTGKGLLARVQEGRTARFSLTPAAEAVLRQAAVRVHSEAPFDHPEGEWTLLSYSMPESRRDLRHQIRARLAWAGFGSVRDGLWIAPGRVDIGQVFSGQLCEEVQQMSEWFAASPMPGTELEDLLRRAWDLPAIQQEHETFVATWTPEAVLPRRPMTQLTLLGADWLQVLRSDPGLPAVHLPAGWLSATSARLYQHWYTELEPASTVALQRLLRTDADRR
jgi:DNA-binding transcriptional regulator PaaX